MKTAVRTPNATDLDAILSYYGEGGLSYEKACAMANVDAATGRAWRAEPQFELALTRARAQVELELVVQMRQASQMGDIKATSWLLERSDPQTFGPPQLQLQQVNVTQNVQNNISLANDLALKAARFVNAALLEET